MKYDELNSKNNHNTFGGEIRESDFCTEYNYGHDIANRIMRAHKFDIKCANDYENTKKTNELKRKRG